MLQRDSSLGRKKLHSLAGEVEQQFCQFRTHSPPLDAQLHQLPAGPVKVEAASAKRKGKKEKAAELAGEAEGAGAQAAGMRLRSAT